MLRLKTGNMKVSTVFKDLVVEWIIGLMLMEKMLYGIMPQSGELERYHTSELE